MSHVMSQSETDLVSIANSLNNSLMYNLSLSSKELFHSNFLAWLSKNVSTKQFFIEIIEQLTGIDLNLDQYKGWIVEREDKNFDLCIKCNDDYILVIENKVKAVPREDQLDEYVDKIKKINDGEIGNTKFLLLTLYKLFEEHDPWIIMRYKELAQAMKDSLKLLRRDYKRMMIKDYIGFIENINELARLWRELLEKGDEKFGISFIDENQSVWETLPSDVSLSLQKMSDLYTKVQFSLYCEKLEKKLESKLKSYNIELYDAEQAYKQKKQNKKKKQSPENEEKLSDETLYIDVHWEYASSSHKGILDVSIPITQFKKPKILRGKKLPEFSIKIQVEGMSYRHVIETGEDNTEYVNKKLFEVGLSDFYTQDIQFFSANPINDCTNPKYGPDEYFDVALYPTDSNKIDERKPFNVYSRNKNNKKEVNFIYQYRKIKNDRSVNEILDNIVNDVQRILAALEKSKSRINCCVAIIRGS